jgi:YHS domain-containing protein
MAVDPTHADASRQHRGRDYLFCSEACASTFDEGPARFAGRRSRSGELRASEEMRERATELLRRAYARGRLSTDELEERLGHVYAARTREELRSVLRDLPEYRRWRAQVRRRRRWRWLVPRRFRSRSS